MKRLALLLGSLLVVSAAASAKEVVPAPVVVEETPVKIIEKEVIVYRDRAPEWKPTGVVSLQETYYGKTEGQGYKENPKEESWNSKNEYLRTQAETKIQMTENARMDIRSRLYAGTHESETLKKGDQFRARFFYDHGTLGSSKVKATSMAKYQKDGSGRGTQKVELGVDFDFADYMFSNDYVKTTKLAIGPRVSRTWSDVMWKYDKDGNEIDKHGYYDSVGIYFDWVTELPFGFGTEVELDSMAYQVGNKKGVFSSYDAKKPHDIKAEKTQFVVPVKAIITHDYNLYSNDAVTFAWHAEGGLDTYDFSNRKSEADLKPGKASRQSYEAYLQPEVTLTYHVTKTVDVYGTVGGEYRNWKYSNRRDASHWRWQPYGRVGVNAKF